MKITCKNLTLGLASAALLTLYGCGGGGGGASGSPTSSTSQPATTNVPVTVIDGPISNATVCLDKNANGVCDAGEPTARTDATGKTVLQIDNADVGKFSVLAVVGTDAIDTDRPTTPITTPFTMTAPADKPAVISPLTTMVQTLVQNAGLSSTAAEAQLKLQTGLNVSLFEDFTKNTTADGQTAGTLARMLVVTTQQNSDAIKSTIGSAAIDGTVVKAADIDKLIQARLIEILSNLLAALADPAIAAATTPAAKEAAIQAQTTVLLAVPGNAITTASVATLVGIANATAAVGTEVVSTPVAGLGLRALTFTDASNWFVRAFTASAAQNTPDSAGNLRNIEQRIRSVSSGIANWSVGGEPRRQADLNFNGTTWASCPLNFESISTAPDARGNSSYNYCNNRETGTSNRANFDVSGRTMASVYQQVSDAGFTNLTIANAVTALGTDNFPTGSSLRYQTGTPLSSANTYIPGTDNIVQLYSAAVTNGGIAANQGAGVQCNSTEASPSGRPTNTPSTLEAMFSSATGTPCIFTGGSFVYGGSTFTNPDARNEWWGATSLSFGTIGSAPFNSGVAPGFYTNNQLIRVAFAGSGTNPVTYYSCKQRFSDGSSRNCSIIGSGNYTITTQGDARVLTLSNSPAVANSLGYQRIFVERGGKVFFGYKNDLVVSKSARFNKTATDALLARLGVPAVSTNTPLALTNASYEGNWNFTSGELPSQSTLLRIARDGSSSCVNTNGGTVTNYACAITFTNLATGAFTSSTLKSGHTAAGPLNFLTGAIAGTSTNGLGTVVENYTGARR